MTEDLKRKFNFYVSINSSTKYLMSTYCPPESDLGGRGVRGRTSTQSHSRGDECVKEHEMSYGYEETYSRQKD